MMKSRKKLCAVTGMIVAVSLLIPNTAHASTDSPTVDDLSTQQTQAIADWEAGAANTSTVTRPSAKTALSASGTTATSGTSSMKLYRGSWVMWAEERVNFGWASGGRVTWSDAYQAAGYVGASYVRRNGTKRIFASSTRHDWRGSYTVGAAVPTPWGSVKVYSATSFAFSRVLSIGAWQRWED